MRRYWAICLKIGPAVEPHHWFFLGRRIQMLTTYLGSSVEITPAKVPFVHPSPLWYLPLNEICAVPDLAQSFCPERFALLSSGLVLITLKSPFFYLFRGFRFKDFISILILVITIFRIWWINNISDDCWFNVFSSVYECYIGCS